MVRGSAVILRCERSEPRRTAGHLTMTRLNTDGLQQFRGQRAFVVESVRAGHQDMAVTLSPFDEEIAAGQRYDHLPAYQLAARGGDGGSAGRRAAGAGQPRASLPGPDFKMVGADDLHQRDIAAIGE